MTARTIVGIDLGTSFSSVAQLDSRGFPKPVANAENKLSTPSVAYFGSDGAVVGEQAEELEKEHPERVVRHAKRFLGEPHRSWEIDGVEYTPLDVARTILRKLRKDTEARVGPIHKAVITVPAHFNTEQRSLTISAAQQAGLDVLDIVNEPVAAALFYVLGEAGEAFAALAGDQTALVYDLGGGTFDLSLVEYSASDVRVLSASGDLKLGGIDWNQRIVSHVAEHCSREHGFDPRDRGRPKMFAQLAASVEKAKYRLTEKDVAQVSFDNGSRAISVMLSRERFEEMTRDLLERTMVLTEQLVRQTGKGWHGIDAILPVGGSSRMPMVRKMIKDLVKVVRIHTIDPELSIALGAALYGGIVASRSSQESLSGKAQERFAAIRTRDVSTQELALLVIDERGRRVPHRLIGRNEPLPASARFRVCTASPNQTRISLKIVETMRETAAEKGTPQVICRCVIDKLPPGLPENSPVDVDFSYSASGLLQVIAHHRETGLLSTATTLRADT